MAKAFNEKTKQKEKHNIMTTDVTTSEMDNRYAGHGVGTAGLTLGIIGTALAGLGGGASILGGLGRNGGQQGPGPFITREEFALNQQIMSRDSELADLKAEMNDEKKLVEVYTTLANKINEVNTTVASNRDRADDKLAGAVEKINSKIDLNKGIQDVVNAQQLAYNGSNNATVQYLQNQVGQLYNMTKLVIPNNSVCPGWGSVTITPSTLSA